MTVYAVTVCREAPLSSEFGLAYATKLFGEETIADLPRYVRGPRKGQIKAWLIWEKAEKGGWHRTYGVTRPGLVGAYIAAGSGDPTALRGTWMGRINELRGSRAVLSAEYRAQEAVNEIVRGEHNRQWVGEQA